MHLDERSVDIYVCLCFVFRYFSSKIEDKSAAKSKIPDKNTLEIVPNTREKINTGKSTIFLVIFHF